MNFPKYISRPRIIIVFEIDTVALVLGTSISAYFIFMTMGLPIWLYFIGSLATGYMTLKILKEIKNGDELRGFFFHFAYRINLVKPRLDEKRYPELKRIKKKSFLPLGIECEFYN